MLVINLFAGGGGWDLGARSQGIFPLGLENDERVCGTRWFAGLATWDQDVSAVTDEQLERLASVAVEGLIASPPCQDFSAAGKQAGLRGQRGQLMWQVPRWVEALRPKWIACEQVLRAKGHWEEFANVFADAGYKTWVGNLNAADYGVPQARQRAFLLASTEHQPAPPAPTHEWVSVQEALGIRGYIGFPRRDEQGGYRARDLRDTSRPAQTVTSKSRSWNVFDEAGEPVRPIRLEEASVLQGFPADYPWKAWHVPTYLFEQVADAVPPALAAAALGAVRS